MHSYMQYIRYGYGYMLLYFFGCLLAGFWQRSTDGADAKKYTRALCLFLYTRMRICITIEFMNIIRCLHLYQASCRLFRDTLALPVADDCVFHSHSHNFLCETSIETVCECVSVVEAIEYIAPMNMQQNRCCSTFNANNVEYTLIKK